METFKYYKIDSKKRTEEQIIAWLGRVCYWMQKRYELNIFQIQTGLDGDDFIHDKKTLRISFTSEPTDTVLITIN